MVNETFRIAHQMINTIVMIYATLSIQIVHAQIINKPVISFCSGSVNSCVVFSNKKMKCIGNRVAWGASLYKWDYPESYDYSMAYVDVGTSVNINNVVCGGLHTCVKTATNDVKCLGSNIFGQLGIGLFKELIGKYSGDIGDNLPYISLGTGLKVVDLALGSHHSCALVTGGKVKCFGYNNYGQLGVGDRGDRGSLSSDMGNNLIDTEMGIDIEAISIMSGSTAHHNCVILSKPTANAQRIKCWGYNEHYQLGYGDQDNRGDNVGEMGDDLPLVDLGIESRVKQLALGRYHTCALLVNNDLKCFGDGSYGQLGSGATSDISATGDAIPTVLIDSGKTIKYLTAGGERTCIVYNDQLTMKCIGWSSSGILGQGDKLNRGDSPTTMLPSIPAIDLGTGSLKIYYIQSGLAHVCVYFEDTSMKCFGYDIINEPVYGTDSYIGEQPYEMGTNLTYVNFFPKTNAPTKAPTRNPSLTLTKAPTIAPTSKSDAMLNAKAAFVSQVFLILSIIIVTIF